MTRQLAAAFACLSFAVAAAACTHAQAGAAGPGPSAPPPPLPGTEPVRVVGAAPVPVARPSAPPAFDTTFPAALRGAKIEATANGIAFVVVEKRLHAVDLATGTERWMNAEDTATTTVAAGDRVVFAGTWPGDTTGNYVGYDVETGRRVVTLADTYRGFIVDGVLYVHGRQDLTAYDASDGRRYWRTLGAGAALGEPPLLVGTTLLQDFTDSGATMVNSIYAFDVRDGHVLWTRSNGPHPIGYGDGVIYVNTTWCGSMASCFHSLDVDAVDLATGTSRDHHSYVLDDITDTIGGGMAAAVDPHVSGGYVYFGLHGRWYRYDAGREPAQGHGVRLEGFTPRAWFDDGAMLVTRGDELDVARSYADRVELQRVAAGALRSTVVMRPDGTRYTAVGDELVAVEPTAAAARVVGRVPCAEVTDIIAWGSRVAARCAANARGVERVLGFADRRGETAATPAPGAHPVAPAQAALVPKLHRFENALPEHTSATDIAVAPDGSLAVVLDRSSFEPTDAIARITPSGAVTLVPLPVTADPDERVRPSALAVDRHGAIWFDDTRHATLTSLDAAGRFTPHLIGEPKVNGPRSRSVGGIRVATGADGEIWFARTGPTPQVGRVSGVPRYDIPPDVGTVDLMRRGSDGALWFVNRSQLGRITASGAFTHAPLPAALTAHPVFDTVMAPGPAGTMWLTNSTTLVQTDGKSVLRTVTLPNATTYVYDIVTGCDGSLYVAETVPQIAHVLPNGHVDEYPLAGLFEVRKLARGADCRIWLGGFGDGRPEVATFELVPTSKQP